MKTTPASLRLHIGFFGRMNAGKSSLLNRIAGQEVAITSPVPGTTTDVVEKPMELLPLGPVVLLDTAGLDDTSELAARRLQRTQAALERSDVAVLVVESGAWGEAEEALLEAARVRRVPVLAVVNKTDLRPVPAEQARRLSERADAWMEAECVRPETRAAVAERFRERLLAIVPEAALRSPPLVADLVRPGGWMVLVTPIDLQAPKGRLILPQVQTIRDAVDRDAAAVVVKEGELSAAFANLRSPPDLVVCDSQVVRQMIAEGPPSVPCTTFSILFARARGDLAELARGAAAVDRLRPGARVLIAEACTHHALADDIGRVKIPRWLRQRAGGELQVEHCHGRDYPPDLREFDLVVHCGACMLTRREMLHRIDRARTAGVPITNYGLTIAAALGAIDRVLSPFPEAREAWRKAAGRDGGKRV